MRVEHYVLSLTRSADGMDSNVLLHTQEQSAASSSGWPHDAGDGVGGCVVGGEAGGEESVTNEISDVESTADFRIAHPALRVRGVAKWTARTPRLPRHPVLRTESHP